MGNTQSPSSDPRFVSASRAFTQNEVDDIKSMFQSLASQSHTDGQSVSQSVFQAYFGLPTPLGDTMFHLVTQQQTRNNDQRLSFEDLLIAKATYDKGTKHEVEEFLYQLLDVTRDGTVGRSDVQAVLKCMFDLIFSPSDSENGSCSRDDIVNIFLDAAHFSKRDEGSSEATMSFEDFRSLCTHLPSVRKFLGNLLIPHHPGRLGSQVPHLLHSESIDSNMLILRKEFSWHIGGALSQLELGEWKLLYHSAFNGRSFNTFLGYIINNVGPTVLIIKDKEGYIYGGYASQPWERHGDFYGDMKSFLFQLYPKASIFRPTGANNNLQWCAVNFSSESIPNGVGFGGKVNHFGLFLSAGFDQGHTFACTTFGSPCLSKTSQINPEVIECWGIIKQGRQQEGRDATTQGTTILERFKEDRHMLNMVGLANSSE